MVVRPFRHLVSLLRRGDVLPGPGEPTADGGSSLSRRSSLHDLADAVPGLREELVDRARAAGLLVGWVGLLGMPAWNVVDRISAPEVADRFRELVTRVRLEREQDRTQSLLEQLRRLSQEDPLTGLANRRRWDGALAEACSDARQHGGDVAVLLVDLDHFKQVNDRHGHAGGDGALQHVAALLCRGVRAADLVARLGGDELAVLLPGADLDRATELAERLRRDVHGLQPAGFAPGELTVTLGVAAATGTVAYPMELMSQADAQLYRAKITRNAVGSPQRELSGR